MPPRWLAAAVRAVRRCAVERRVRFTLKAVHEIAAVDLGLEYDDACDILATLQPTDFGGRLRSRVTGEWMYVFTPNVGGVALYVKLVLRRECVIISFHEMGETREDND